MSLGLSAQYIVLVILLTLVSLQCAIAANVETPTTKKDTPFLVYKSYQDGVATFSDQKPATGAYLVLDYSCFACDVNSTTNWYKVPLNTRSYSKDIHNMATKYGVSEALVRAVIHAESNFKANAVSRTGAQGLMQLMPATAKEMGVSNSFNPSQNIKGGVKYLAQLLKQFKYNTKLSTAAYNAGPNAVIKYNGIPPYKETQVYVDRVNILFTRYQRGY